MFRTLLEAFLTVLKTPLGLTILTNIAKVPWEEIFIFMRSPNHHDPCITILYDYAYNMYVHMFMLKLIFSVMISMIKITEDLIE